jgi:hypothetical protein
MHWRDDSCSSVLERLTQQSDRAASACASATAIPDATSKLTDTHDFNGDGKSGIAWRNSDADVRIFLMNGTMLEHKSYRPQISSTFPTAGRSKAPMPTDLAEQSALGSRPKAGKIASARGVIAQGFYATGNTARVVAIEQRQKTNLKENLGLRMRASHYARCLSACTVRS